jgi:hypothetical protein
MAYRVESPWWEMSVNGCRALEKLARSISGESCMAKKRGLPGKAARA